MVIRIKTMVIRIITMVISIKTMVITIITMVIRIKTMVIRTKTTIVIRHLGATSGATLGATNLKKTPTDYQRVMRQVWDVRVDVEKPCSTVFNRGYHSSPCSTVFNRG